MRPSGRAGLLAGAHQVAVGPGDFQQPVQVGRAPVEAQGAGGGAGAAADHEEGGQSQRVAGGEPGAVQPQQPGCGALRQAAGDLPYQRVGALVVEGAGEPQGEGAGGGGLGGEGEAGAAGVVGVVGVVQGGQAGFPGPVGGGWVEEAVSRR